MINSANTDLICIANLLEGDAARRVPLAVVCVRMAHGLPKIGEENGNQKS